MTTHTPAPITTEEASPFDALMHVDGGGNEYWSARDLMTPLGYPSWQTFNKLISRARQAAANALGEDAAQDHFMVDHKMVQIGSGAERALDDWHLTRYASYLVAMNGDPAKPSIAMAQHYFAVRTREAETATALAASAPNEELGTGIYTAIISMAHQSQALLQQAQYALDMTLRHDRQLYDIKAELKTLNVQVANQRLEQQGAWNRVVPDPAAPYMPPIPPITTEELPELALPVPPVPVPAVSTQAVTAARKAREAKIEYEHIPNGEQVTYTVGQYVALTSQPNNESNRRSLGQHAGVIAEDMGILPYRDTPAGQAEYPQAVWDAAIDRQAKFRGGPIADAPIKSTKSKTKKAK